jgi:PadR family transcriptional regulator PadR
MPQEKLMSNKLDLLQGTLDLLVLQTLYTMGPLHGYGIARRIKQISGNRIIPNQGTIYASIVRLQQRRQVKGEWGTSENNRRARYYSLTKAGRKELEVQAANWQRMAEVFQSILASPQEDTSR